MSKYVRKDLFAKFKEQVQQESTPSERKGPSNKFPNPAPGEYKFRFLPDKTGEQFYKKYFYHMFQVGDKWTFIMCPKTFDFEAYCPLCAVANKLYKTGNESDKKEAGRFKRKEKFVSNIYVLSDPRDVDKDDEMKQGGKVKLYEFGTKLESQIRASVMDEEEGVGLGAFDPESGYNFTLRVTETKPGPDGKKWLSFDTSSFARNQTAIADNDEEIEKIMEGTFDLNKYLEAMKANEEEVIDIIKEEQVYELIQDEYERIVAKRNKKSTTAAPKNEVVMEEEVDEPVPMKDETPTPKKEETPNSEDEELLEALNGL